MMIITSSKSVPKIASEGSQKQGLKLPAIILEKPETILEGGQSNFASGCTTKKLRHSRNDVVLKNFVSDNEGTNISDKLRVGNVKRKSLMQNSVYRPSRSVRRQSVKSEMEDVYRAVCRLIGLDYHVQVSDSLLTESSKGTVQKGNNSLLVRQILKSRGYWNIKGTLDEEDTSNNLIWTQFRQRNVVCSKPTRQPYMADRRGQLSKPVKSSIMEFKNIFKLFLFPEELKDELSLPEMLAVFKRLSKEQPLLAVESKTLKLTNHLPQQQQLSNKKSLFQNLQGYYKSKEMDPFDFIPITFHLASSTTDPEFARFVEHANDTQSKKKSLWIIKPGEFTNRGNGITVERGVEGVKTQLQSFKSKHTYLVQSYIRPYLYCQRKFDIRCYLLVVMVNNQMKGYWYQQGYIRTSAEVFSFKKMDKLIHLTNDAVQKYGQNYGKYEAGNKISYAQLQKYIQKNDDKDFIKDIVPKMRDLAKDALFATKGKLGSDRSEQAFQIYGLDFMLDQQLRPWLIQFNTNPCLETSSSLLSRIVPEMIDNAFRIALDPFIIDPNRKVAPGYESFLRGNKFQIVYSD